MAEPEKSEGDRVAAEGDYVAVDGPRDATSTPSDPGTDRQTVGEIWESLSAPQAAPAPIPAEDAPSAPPSPSLTPADGFDVSDDQLRLDEGRELEQARDEGEEDSDPAPEPVTYSGTDFDVEGLVRRLQRSDMVIPNFGRSDDTIETAGFQRSFVWRRPQMDRFIESLLLGYPVPGIMLVQQKDKRYLVLDGQQRLRTLRYFYEGLHDKVEFSLSNVADDFKGLTYSALSDELRRTLDNTFLQATIVKTDGSDGSLEAVYQIFERLNSGGTQLTPHEIRTALYAGPFIDFLARLNELPSWRELYGRPSPRLRDQELILRVIALVVSPGDYKRPLKKYLNDFSARHRHMKDFNKDLITKRFDGAARLLADGVGRAAVRPGGGSINAALTEALLVGLVRRLDTGPPPPEKAIASAVAAINADPDLARVVSRATADEESVRTRLGITTREFGRI